MVWLRLMGVMGVFMGIVLFWICDGERVFLEGGWRRVGHKNDKVEKYNYGTKDFIESKDTILLFFGVEYPPYSIFFIDRANDYVLCCISILVRRIYSVCF